MKVLLDECLPRKLKQLLVNHEVFTVPQMGWAGVKNGALLRLAEQQFDLFITVDRNLPHQQNLDIAHLTIVILVAKSNRLEDLRPLMEEVQEILNNIGARDIIRIGG